MKLLLVALALCCVAYSVYGLKCYTCENGKCDDAKSQDCPAEKNKVCYKLLKDKKVDSKGCEAEGFCKDKDADTCYTCTKDDCNAAGYQTISIASLSLIAFVTLRNIL